MTRFQRKPTIYKLVWDDDDDLAGLVVKAKALSMGSLLQLLPLIDLVHAENPDMSQIDVLLRRFGSCLVEWNLDDEDGNPVPATYEGLMGEEPQFIQAVLKAWTEAFAVVDPTSPPGSPPGATAEAGIPMETLAPSPESLSVPA